MRVCLTVGNGAAQRLHSLEIQEQFASDMERSAKSEPERRFFTNELIKIRAEMRKLRTQ